MPHSVRSDTTRPTPCSAWRGARRGTFDGQSIGASIWTTWTSEPPILRVRNSDAHSEARSALCDPREPWAPVPDTAGLDALSSLAARQTWPRMQVVPETLAATIHRAVNESIDAAIPEAILEAPRASGAEAVGHVPRPETPPPPYARFDSAAAPSAPSPGDSRMSTDTLHGTLVENS
ncbi:MAG TPA: hypothetical protein VL424_13930, partial [Pararobbsia sp.]|nr:hypothetical protein [Pararobbsia sp.]